ncbi:unnamed protein product, partial [Darwinula stevensoni]
RVLVLVHCDVDALCACSIIVSLLRSEHVLYTLVCVNGIQELRDAYAQHVQQVRYVIFINCGATLDLVELLDPPENQVLFVADMHRPMDVCNIYSAGQVCLLMQPEDDEEIPSYGDIFREEEARHHAEDSEEEEEEEGAEEENEGDEGENGRRRKRRRFDEEALMKRREKREWENHRRQILFDYTQFSYYGSPTSVLMYNLAWRLSKDNNELLWLAIVGLSDLFLNGHMDKRRYLLHVGDLQSHVARLNHTITEDSLQMSADSMHISFEKELQLALFRHWSLWESLRHSPYTACKFRLWSLKGEKRLHEFLAELGLPLVQCKQKYCAMDVSLRNELFSLLESKSEKYELEDLIYGSFLLQLGLRYKFSAADFVFSLGALLESHESYQDVTEGNGGREAAAESQFETSADSPRHDKHSFSWTFLYLSHPTALARFAYFVLLANEASRRNKRSRTLPLVLCLPVTEGAMHIPGIDQSVTFSILIGIPPFLFGKAFEQAAEKTESLIYQDCFDPSIVHLRTEDRTKFLDALVSLMT